jgi:hypothetical protein
MVMDVSTLGRRIQGARIVARLATYVSSAEVSSISLVKCVMRASRVAMFERRSWLRVFCNTEMRAESVDSEAGVEYMVFIIS